MITRGELTAKRDQWFYCTINAMTQLSILLHSSKTMRQAPAANLSRPPLAEKASQLGDYLKTLTPAQIEKVMHISSNLATETHQRLQSWAITPQHTAIDSFVGDIYSGLQAKDLSPKDREYATGKLFILSGLYGVLRPLDGIAPYRCEMAYRFPDSRFSNLYQYWGSDIAAHLPAEGSIINTSSAEYMRAVTPFINNSRLITPKFLTRHPKTGAPTFVTVHAKISRGAFAHWLIKKQIEGIDDLKSFSDLGYHYDTALSTPSEPTFVCDSFGGIGLSIRLDQ